MMNKQEGAYCIEYLKGGYTWTCYSGCKHQEMGVCKIEDCWARRVTRRMAGNPKSPYSKWGFEPHFYPERIQEPLFKKKPSLIGVAFMGDLFGEWVPAEWIEQVIDACQRAEWHKFLFLTKNPSRYRHFVFPDNCWLGTSITGGRDVVNYDRVEELMRFERNFVSIEPYLYEHLPINIMNVEWIIVGGLTGKDSQQPPKEWMKSLIGLTENLNIPLFIKSNSKYSKVIQQKPKELILL